MAEKERMIYLDNSATTEICTEAKEKMLEAINCFGNPSSLHSAGLEAEKMLSDARENVLRTLGVRVRKPDDAKRLIFTSCGTEASSLAIFGTAYAKRRRDANRILTTDSEHPSVENAMQRLETDGFEVIRIPTRGGALDMDALRKALDSKSKVLMASFMMVNNETGALYDVKNAFAEIRAAYPDVITHCDAVQGYLKTRFTPAGIGADLVTLSGHKVHAPKGIGALYVNPELLRAKKIVPFLVGGGQESGMRSGTENMIGIAGFGAAAGAVYDRLDETVKEMEYLRKYTLERLAQLDVTLNIPSGECAPHIINLTLPDIKSETMLHYLSSAGICVSSGSACSSHSSHPSRSLSAFGLTPHAADCSLRVSFSEFNTVSDCDSFCNILAQGISSLVRTR